MLHYVASSRDSELGPSPKDVQKDKYLGKPVKLSLNIRAAHGGAKVVPTCRLKADFYGIYDLDRPNFHIHLWNMKHPRESTALHSLNLRIHAKEIMSSKSR